MQSQARIRINTDTSEVINPHALEVWIASKSYWEQTVWRSCLDKEEITSDDIESFYGLVIEDLSIVPKTLERPVLNFRNEFLTNQVDQVHDPVVLVRISGFEGVNAIPEACSISLGQNLTVIYGGNGTGKSGIARLLCNACFSRGDRSVLPNVRETEKAVRAKAEFSLHKDGALHQVAYLLGDNFDDLKRFSVFDSQSVLIHLNQSNELKLTPGQIQVFDRVAEVIMALEEKFREEERCNKRESPFQNMFFGEVSASSSFFHAISSETLEQDLLIQISFDPQKDAQMLAELEKYLEEKKKLDVAKKKKELLQEAQQLEVLCRTLSGIVDNFTETRRVSLDQLIKDIVEKREVVKQLGSKSFDNSVIQSVGSEEWKSLLKSAKILRDKELADSGHLSEVCLLCNQALGEKESSLFERYWAFLESKAEQELSTLAAQRRDIKTALECVATSFPEFLDTDPGVATLVEARPKIFEKIKAEFASLRIVLSKWLVAVESIDLTQLDKGPTIDLASLIELIGEKRTDEANLVDPSADIQVLSKQVLALKHKKDASMVKDAALEYLHFLKWKAKISRVNFAAIKSATTRKRTEFFNETAAEKYREQFNQELVELDCDFGLVMTTSGDHGNTVKGFRLDFADGYTPSEILSEGEQNACSLADFLTEAQLDSGNCGIIFDDPVTSLDHIRKDKIAKRLSDEAAKRQVVVFTHDIIFLSKLISHADQSSIPVTTHWMRKIEGVPGFVEQDTRPSLSALAANKNDAQQAVAGFSNMSAKDQEAALMRAYDFMRCACEGMVEEVLFVGTIRRYDDHVKMQNLEEMSFDQPAALRIVALHGKISEAGYMHNRSDIQREQPLDLVLFRELENELNDIERALTEGRKQARKDREARKRSQST